MNILTTVFTGFLLLRSLFAEVEGCNKPACCGCDTSNAKAKIRVLTKQFLQDGSKPSTRANVAPLLQSPTTMAFVQGELCRNGWYCCKFDAPILYVNSLLGDDAEGVFWIEKITRDMNNEFTVEALGLYNYPTHTPPGGIAFRYFIRWVQDESCNFKIAGLEMVSLACQIPVELNCAGCAS